MQKGSKITHLLQVEFWKAAQKKNIGITQTGCLAPSTVVPW